MDAEIIVVGSGASAVHAAQTLVEEGREVLMLDVGVAARDDVPAPPLETFCNLRKRDADQHGYILGPRFESLSWGPTKAGAQVTPARRYMLARVGELTPLRSENFVPFESLAHGGLGVGWGAGSFCFTEQELSAAGLDPQAIAHSYATVAARIGVSRPDDSLIDECASAIGQFEEPLRPSRCIADLLGRFQRRRQRLTKRGFKVGRTPLAMLSRDRGARRAHAYREMEFYCDEERSVYRPWMTLDELQRMPRFRYQRGVLVECFENLHDQVVVSARSAGDRQPLQFRSKRLVLCAGVLGTARIFLRSNPEIRELPLLCNPYSYVPTLAWRNLGREVEERQLSLAQLSVLYDPDGTGANVSMASAYTYRSLMLFRLIKEAPLDLAYSRRLFQFLQSALVIFGVHHPDGFDGGRSLRLANGGRGLEVDFHYSAAQEARSKTRDRAFRKLIRALGCIPLASLKPAAGASIHYGGALAVSEHQDPRRTQQSGRLWGAPNVYVADGSLLGYLPAKGVTLTLMAIGDRVARHVARSLG